MKLTDTQKETILEITGMSNSVLDEAIAAGTLDGFGGNEGAENFSDAFNYSITEKNGECILDIWHRMTSDSQFKVTPSGEAIELTDGDN